MVLTAPMAPTATALMVLTPMGRRVALTVSAHRTVPTDRIRVDQATVLRDRRQAASSTVRGQPPVVMAQVDTDHRQVRVLLRTVLLDTAQRMDRLPALPRLRIVRHRDPAARRQDRDLPVLRLAPLRPHRDLAPAISARRRIESRSFGLKCFLAFLPRSVGEGGARR